MGPVWNSRRDLMTGCTCLNVTCLPSPTLCGHQHSTGKAVCTMTVTHGKTSTEKSWKPRSPRSPLHPRLSQKWEVSTALLNGVQSSQRMYLTVIHSWECNHLSLSHLIWRGIASTVSE